MSGVQMITVSEDDSGQRIDRWLRRLFPHVNQGRIEKMCRKGELRVDGGRVKSGTRLEAGQVVRIPPLPDGPGPEMTPRDVARDDAEMIRACVIYRDGSLIALNKPPGLASQGGSGQTRHLDGFTPALSFEKSEPPRLVHRLDKDTSGVILLARSRSMAAALGEAFRAKTTRKVYWAAVAGVPGPAMGTIRYGLVKQGARGQEKMRCIHPRDIDRTEGAKRATTDYAVIEGLGSRAAWVGLSPITGRTHQLRAHMAEIGHPIAGDGKYGGSGQENPGDGWGASLGQGVSGKLHLHARSITFDHPKTGDRMTLTAPLPAHMSRTWEMFGWDAGAAPEDPFEDQA